MVTPAKPRIWLRTSPWSAKPPESSIRISQLSLSGFIYILFLPFLSLPRISLSFGTAEVSLRLISKPLATSAIALSNVSTLLIITRGLPSSFCLSIVTLTSNGKPDLMVSSKRVSPSENSRPSKLLLPSKFPRKHIYCRFWRCASGTSLRSRPIWREWYLRYEYPEKPHCIF